MGGVNSSCGGYTSGGNPSYPTSRGSISNSGRISNTNNPKIGYGNLDLNSCQFSYDPGNLSNPVNKNYKSMSSAYYYKNLHEYNNKFSQIVLRYVIKKKNG